MAQVGLYFWSIAGIKDRPFWKVWCGSSTANSFRSFFLGSAFRRSSLCLPECGTPKPLMVLITFPVVLVEASVKSRPLGSYEALIFFSRWFFTPKRIQKAQDVILFGAEVWTTSRIPTTKMSSSRCCAPLLGSWSMGWFHSTDTEWLKEV